MKLFCFICYFFSLTVAAFSQSDTTDNAFLVCGDHQVLLVDYRVSRDSVPHIIWSWDAHTSNDLPTDFRLKKFNSIDDCKAIKGGEEILVSSSSGAVAVVRRRDQKVLFYANVPNAHSVEALPGDLLATAASTAPDGNKIMIFNVRTQQHPLFTDSLYSAHGVVWHEKRNSLFALGYDVLREYKIVGNGLNMIDQWKIPGIGGHDLQMTPDGEGFFITEHNGAWLFDIQKKTFKKIGGFPDAHNIKSLGQNKAGQIIYTVPEESWWTYHVSFFGPERKFVFPDMKVYKARWFRPSL
jgi:hypothetical protein